MEADEAGGEPRFDERDTIFARMARELGTTAYVEYYGATPS